MIRRSVKGSRRELQVHRWLEERGFVVHTTKRVPYSNNDVFGVFDHIALVQREGEQELEVREYVKGRRWDKLERKVLNLKFTDVIAVQTKANKLPQGLEEFRSYAKNMVILWATWVDREKEPRIYYLNEYLMKEA